MSNFLPTNPIAYWIVIGLLFVFFAVVSIISLVSLNRVKKALREQFGFLSEQNERMRIEQLLSFSKQTKEFAELTGVMTDKKLEELEKMHENAVKENDSEKAELVASKRDEIKLLRIQLLDAAENKDKLESKLRNAVLTSGPVLGMNALKIYTGQILLVRYQNKYGAVQPVEQAAGERGAFVRYVWWYQPDGSGIFTNENAQYGFGETGETMGSQLEIGPLKLSWSRCDEGIGWVYFGPTVVPSPEYELVIANEVDISKIDAVSYVFAKYEEPEDE